MKQVRPEKLTWKEAKAMKAMCASIETEKSVPWGSNCNTCKPLKDQSKEDFPDEQLAALAKVLDTVLKSNPDDNLADEAESNDYDTNCMYLDCYEEVGEHFQTPVPTVPLCPARQINQSNVKRASEDMQISITSPQFCELPSYRAQVHYLRSHTQSLRRIADVLDVTVGTIQHLLRPL